MTTDADGFIQTIGLTVVMISHEQALLQEFAHEMITLQDGRVAARARTMGAN